MAINPNSENGPIESDEDQGALAEGVIDLVQEAFASFIAATPGLESPQAQIVLFTACAQRLAQGGLPLGAMLRHAARVYGVDIEQLEITDGAGDTLVRHTQVPPGHTTH